MKAEMPSLLSPCDKSSMSEFPVGSEPREPSGGSMHDRQDLFFFKDFQTFLFGTL